jgi:hypothetical protein
MRGALPPVGEACRPRGDGTKAVRRLLALQPLHVFRRLRGRPLSWLTPSRPSPPGEGAAQRYPPSSPPATARLPCALRAASPFSPLRRSVLRSAFGNDSGRLGARLGHREVSGSWVGGYWYDRWGSYHGAFILTIGISGLGCLALWGVAPRHARLTPSRPRPVPS